MQTFCGRSDFWRIFGIEQLLCNALTPRFDVALGACGYSLARPLPEVTGQVEKAGVMNQYDLPRPMVVLGLAGLAPQALCLLLVAFSQSYRWAALAAACFYAAVILSFLGGLWWMAALQAGERRASVYLLAVVPSLAAWAALLPWVVGATWPVPSLFALGGMLLVSPLADRTLARSIKFPAGWLKLRTTMASGLGLLTLAIALV